MGRKTWEKRGSDQGGNNGAEYGGYSEDGIARYEMMETKYKI
jgi:hypothetical protein